MEDKFEVEVELEERLVGYVRFLFVQKWVWSNVGRFAKELKQELVLEVVGWVV